MTGEAAAQLEQERQPLICFVDCSGAGCACDGYEDEDEEATATCTTCTGEQRTWRGRPVACGIRAFQRYARARGLLETLLSPDVLWTLVMVAIAFAAIAKLLCGCSHLRGHR